MLTDILLISVVLIALLIASISDIKIKEVPDYVSFGLIASALSIRLLHSAIYSDWLYFLYGVMGFAGMFALGSLIYYTKQWGGGDAKLLMGLGAAFATTPFYLHGNLAALDTMPFGFLLSIIANIFIIGAVYGLVWSMIIFLKHWRSSFKEFKRSIKAHKRMQIIFFTVSAALFIISFAFQDLQKSAILILIAFLLFYLYLYLFIKSSEKVGMYKNIAIKKLREGDWVAEDIRIRGKLVYSKKSLGIEKAQIEKISKTRKKSVLVKEGVAFVPSIAISVIFSLIFGNIIFFLI